MLLTVRVLYADTDQMGVVNHAVPLRWFEQARAEWLRNKGMTYREVERSGSMLPVYELSVRYRRPARYDDMLELRARIDAPRPVRVMFHYQVIRQADGELLIEGSTHHACIDGSGKPRRFPEDLMAIMQAHHSSW